MTSQLHGVFIFSGIEEALFILNVCDRSRIVYCCMEFEDLLWLFVFDHESYILLHMVVMENGFLCSAVDITGQQGYNLF